MNFPYYIMQSLYVTQEFASGFDVDQYNQTINGQQTKQSGNLMDQLKYGFEGWMEPVYTFGIQIFTIIFIAAIIALTLATILRNGQWTKWGTGSLFLSFISLLILKIAPIIVLTKEVTEFTLVASDGIILLKEVSIYMSIFVILIGFVLKAAYKVNQHQDYYRWSKSLFMGGVMMLMLAFMAPFIFQVI